MTVLKCDKCRKEINIASRFICRRRIRVFEVEDDTEEFRIMEKKYDLCEECSSEIEKVIQTGGIKSDA